ncbi:M23 family metallopeptidase, partial [Streptomyces albus]|uniref:M23 family metallopeptidase n=1 Tax=Streptomyces albus TaxID=1888 RepID=UPI00099ECC59
MARLPAGTHPSRVAGTPTPAAAEEKDSAKIASTAWGGAREGAGGKARPGRFWPVEGAEGARRPRVPRGWDPPPQPWAPGHRGVDLAARPGQPVLAVADGKVSFAGKVAGRGVVSIELTGTGEPPLRTTYQPLRPSVRKGDRVRAGDRVGTVTLGTHCPRSCLHWGLLRGRRYLNPLSLLPAWLLGGRSRLLPVFGVPLPATTEPAAGREREVGRPRTAGGPADWTAACVLTAAALWSRWRLGGGLPATAPRLRVAGIRRPGRRRRGAPWRPRRRRSA